MIGRFVRSASPHLYGYEDRFNMSTGEPHTIPVAKSAAHQCYCILCYACEKTRHSSDVAALHCSRFRFDGCKVKTLSKFLTCTGLGLGYVYQIVSQGMSLLIDPNRF